MIPTERQLLAIAGRATNAANINSIIVALQKYGAKFGLDKPHRLAHFIAQLAHESGNFKYDEEIASGAAYEGRKSLGNTEPGDGKRFKGRGPIQITGRANYTAFTKWCRSNIGQDASDFTLNPDAITTDPWEGIAPIWYWSTRNLNALADANNIMQITKKINGGLNGYSDRIAKYIRAALVFLNYEATDVEAFQRVAQAKGFLPKDVPGEPTQLDGDAGPLTLSALHMMLADAAPVPVKEVTAAPVTVTEVVDVKGPGKGIADTVTGAGVTSGGLSVVVSQLQEQLTPFSVAGGWISRLVVALIIISAVLTIGGLAWRFWAMRKKAQTVAALNAPTVT